MMLLVLLFTPWKVENFISVKCYKRLYTSSENKMTRSCVFSMLTIVVNFCS